VQVLAQARACSCLSPSTFYTHNYWKADKDPEKKTDGGPACSRIGLRNGVERGTGRKPTAIESGDGEKPCCES
jgi:hypothetical protein